jgi:hypothetical protein
MEQIATSVESPRAVSRFEAQLLRLLRSFVRPVGEAALTLPGGRLTMPAGLSPECLHLVRDTLCKAIVVCLARAGGWRRERHLRAGQPADGRLWERSPSAELGLTFSKHSISFLMTLTSGRHESSESWSAPVEELTIGDQFLLFLAYQKMRERESGNALKAWRVIQQHGLVRLFFPEDFADCGAPLDFAPWMQTGGATIVEALQPPLCDRWLEQERAKAGIAEWQRMRLVGQSQEQSLSTFLSACEAAKRPDLARFLLKAMAELLSRDLTPAFWTGGLSDDEAPTRLAERVETKRQALAVLRQVERLAGWTRGYAGTQFFDESYATAQLWLLDWEQHHGDEIAAIAHGLLLQVEPLSMTVPSTESKAQATAPEESREGS